MKVYEIDDYHWFVGATLEECIDEYYAFYGSPDDDVSQARELSSEELDRLVFADLQGENRTQRSFRDQLAIEIETGGEFPRLFATTEY